MAKDWRLTDERKNILKYKKYSAAERFPSMKIISGEVEVVTIKPDMFVVNLLVGGRNLSGKAFKTKSEAVKQAESYMRLY
jgi:hypothetical protein